MFGRSLDASLTFRSVTSTCGTWRSRYCGFLCRWIAAQRRSFCGRRSPYRRHLPCLSPLASEFGCPSLCQSARRGPASPVGYRRHEGKRSRLAGRPGRPGGSSRIAAPFYFVVGHQERIEVRATRNVASSQMQLFRCCRHEWASQPGRKYLCSPCYSVPDDDFSHKSSPLSSSYTEGRSP